MALTRSLLASTQLKVQLKCATLFLRLVKNCEAWLCAGAGGKHAFAIVHIDIANGTLNTCTGCTRPSLAWWCELQHTKPVVSQISKMQDLRSSPWS